MGLSGPRKYALDVNVAIKRQADFIIGGPSSLRIQTTPIGAALNLSTANGYSSLKDGNLETILAPKMHHMPSITLLQMLHTSKSHFERKIWVLGQGLEQLVVNGKQQAWMGFKISLGA